MVPVAWLALLVHHGYEHRALLALYREDQDVVKLGQTQATHVDMRRRVGGTSSDPREAGEGSQAFTDGVDEVVLQARSLAAEVVRGSVDF